MRWQRYKGDWGLTQFDPRAIVAVLWPWRKTEPTSWKASLAMDFQRFIISRFIWKGQKLTLVRRRYTPSYISLTGPPWCVLPSLSLHLLDQHYNPCQWRSFLLWLLPYCWTNSRWEKNIDRKLYWAHVKTIFRVWSAANASTFGNVPHWRKRPKLKRPPISRSCWPWQLHVARSTRVAVQPWKLCHRVGLPRCVWRMVGW